VKTSVRFPLRTLTMLLAAAPAWVGAQVRQTSHLGGGGDVDVSLGRIVASLVVCVIIAALAILLLRQRSGKIDLRGFLARIEPGARAIEVVETRRLSPHADACVLRHAGREYLLVLQQGTAHVLSDRETIPAEPST